MTIPDATTHACPAIGCETQVPRHELTCSEHWTAIPPGLREEITRTYGVDHDAHQTAVLEAVRILVRT